MMITDHIAFGILLSGNRKSGLYLASAVFSILGASIPDIPAYIFPPTSIGYFLHRAYTHSFILAIFYSLIPVLVWKLFRPSLSRRDFLTFWLFCLIGFCSHIFLDLITTFGTAIFFPLSRRNFALDIFHEFDPAFMLISAAVILSFIIHVRRKKPLPRKHALIASLVFLAYFGFAMISRTYSSARYEKASSLQAPGSGYLATFPRTFWRWRGLAAYSGKYLVYLTADGRVQSREFSPLKNPPPAVHRDDFYQAFMTYARYPAQRISGDTFELMNLVYSSRSYCLTFVLDSHGGVVSRSISGFDIMDRDF
jgi:membrane-bound metal-dependent hydrolase YbcI (DUF457 family)